MNFKDPLAHPDTAQIRAAMQNWTLVGSEDQSTEETLERAQSLIHAIAEYQANTDENVCPNWQDMLAFDMAVAKFKMEVHDHCRASEKIRQGAYSIRRKIDKARPSPLIDRLMEFEKIYDNSDNEQKTVKMFLEHVQPVLEMLDLYIENEFYPTWESQKKWEQSELYLPEHEAWFQAQWENSSEDSYSVKSIKGVISELRHRILGAALSESDSDQLRAISITINKQTGLF